MNNVVDDYIDQLGIGKPLSERVRLSEMECLKLIPGPINNVFISDLVDSEGIRQYSNLHFFTDSMVYEQENFVSSTTIWLTSLPAKLTCVVDKQEFDFENHTERSRLSIRAIWVGDFQIDLRASGANCLALMKIYREILLPRV